MRGDPSLPVFYRTTNTTSNDSAFRVLCQTGEGKAYARLSPVFLVTKLFR